MNRILLSLALLLLINSAISSQADEEPRPIVRFYEVSDLLTPDRGHAFDGDSLPGVHRSSSLAVNNGQPVPVEGGFFAVPDHVTPQFAGGMSGYYGPGSAYPTMNDSNNLNGVSHDDLLDAITQLVSPSEWEEVGGPNRISYLGSQLVVRAPPAIQLAVEDFLKQMRATDHARTSVTIRAVWFQVSETEAKTFPTDHDQLTALMKSARPAAVGQITCLNGQAVTLASGLRKTVTTRAGAVVGGSTGAYQPHSVYPNIGTLLEVKPILIDKTSILLNVSSTRSELRGGGKRQHGEIQLDDVSIDSQRIATTVNGRIGEWYIAGSATVEGHPAAPGGKNADKPVLVLVVKATAGAESPPAAEGQ